MWRRRERRRQRYIKDENGAKRLAFLGGPAVESRLGGWEESIGGDVEYSSSFFSFFLSLLVFFSIFSLFCMSMQQLMEWEKYLNIEREKEERKKRRRERVKGGAAKEETDQEKRKKKKSNNDRKI